jgi:hypothetical protein
MSSLANTVRAKIDAGLLPREDHVKLRAGFGQNRSCAVCERVILPSQIEHELRFADGRMIQLHLGCVDLYEAERRQRA